MSHISKIELEVRDLGILDQACKKLKLSLVRGKTTFTWFGKDAACAHAIQVPGARYEIGVLARRGHYELACDYYESNLEKAIGRQGGLLKQAYAVAKTKAEARKKGYSILKKRTKTGIRLKVWLP